MPNGILTDVVISARSSNEKTGGMPTISRPIETSCPSSCLMLPKKFGGNGLCYQNGRGNGTVRKFAADFTVDDAVAKLKPATRPAAVRDNPRRLIRDRVGGDIMTAGPDDPNAVPDVDYVLTVAAVAARVEMRPYGYTHAFDQLSADDITTIAASGYVLNASCNDVAGVERAIAAGMPATIATDDVADGTMIAGRRVILCPEQSGRAASCAACGLCASAAPNRAVVRFAIH